jgi:hypothetical protein
MRHLTENQKMRNGIDKHFVKTTTFFASAAVPFWRNVQTAMQSKSQPSKLKKKLAGEETST